MQLLSFCNNTPPIAKLLASVSIGKFYLGHKMQVKYRWIVFLSIFECIAMFHFPNNLFYYFEVIHFIIVVIIFLRVRKELK